MLVLSRKPSESVVIDGDIRVTVVKISGNKVRLGIEAPPDVAIKRSELSPLAAAALSGHDEGCGPQPACAIG
jgi:carbon storage regulator